MFADLAYDSLIEKINKKIIEVKNNPEIKPQQKDDILKGLNMAKAIVVDSY